MSSLVERLPFMGLLLPLLTVLTVLSVTGAPDHLLAALALVGALALGSLLGGTPLGGRLVSVQRRAEVCRQAGVRSCDPDRPGPVRPRAPGPG